MRSQSVCLWPDDWQSSDVALLGAVVRRGAPLPEKAASRGSIGTTAAQVREDAEQPEPGESSDEAPPAASAECSAAVWAPLPASTECSGAVQVKRASAG